ncbi:hypothetical protein NIES2101_13380 [Calothrix sp. HK-06]|nr:hypothetical protein NIES2101_13380 [Calothrix sp. HK-06]
MLLSFTLQKIKLLNSKGSIPFLLSLVALISMTPAAKAEVIIRSDEISEHPYRWQGHSPRGESECLQSAGQDLIAQLNQQANISAFRSSMDAKIKKELSDKVENAGEVATNTINYTDGRSSSTTFEGVQRGLVVNITYDGFKPGTFGESSKKDRWTNKRESKCWGTLLYRYVIKGPDTLRLRHQKPRQ